MSNQDPVRWTHNIVAKSPNRAEASVRPSDTQDFEIRAMVSDVVRKLGLKRDHFILEIGCGTGVLGMPLARRTARYAGVDFADVSLAVFRKSLEEAGLTQKSELVELDIASATDQELSRLSNFDRVLMYAVLHYAKSDRDGVRFLTATIGSLRPKGVALIGNIPLEELSDDLRNKWLRPIPKWEKISRCLRWILDDDHSFGRTRGWKTAAALYFFAKRILVKLQNRTPFQTARLPPGTVIPLTHDKIEEWLAQVPYQFRWEWLAPAVAVPLYLTRADLRIVREG